MNRSIDAYKWSGDERKKGRGDSNKLVKCPKRWIGLDWIGFGQHTTCRAQTDRCIHCGLGYARTAFLREPPSGCTNIEAAPCQQCNKSWTFIEAILQ
jgi:hypothetical protein